MKKYKYTKTDAKTAEEFIDLVTQENYDPMVIRGLSLTEEVRLYNIVKSKLFEKNEPEITFLYYWMKFFGVGCKIDFNGVVVKLKELAKDNLLMAQTLLGFCYERGEGIRKSIKKAIYWYEKAAILGDATAQDNLAILYYNGEYVKQSYEKAFYWFKKAALQGYAAAQGHLGVQYYYGQGVKKSLKKAIKWYNKAIEQNDANAQYHMGMFYYYDYRRGELLYNDEVYDVARQYFMSAAEQGDDRAQYQIGLCYESGNGESISHKEALFWYAKSAKQLNSDAIKALSRFFEYGIVVERDTEIALKLLHDAEEGCPEDVDKITDRIFKLLLKQCE